MKFIEPERVPVVSPNATIDEVTETITGSGRSFPGIVVVLDQDKPIGYTDAVTLLGYKSEGEYGRNLPPGWMKTDAPILSMGNTPAVLADACKQFQGGFVILTDENGIYQGITSAPYLLHQYPFLFAQPDAFPAGLHGFRELVETMKQGLILQRQGGEIIYANASALDILGMTLEQLLGRTSLDPSWHTIHEDGTPFPGETHPTMKSLLNGKPVINEIMGIYNPLQEKYRWIKTTSVPLFHSGEVKPDSVFAVFEDITDLINTKQSLKRSEYNFKSIVNALNLIFYTLDKDQNFTGIYGIWLEKERFDADFIVGRKAGNIFGEEGARVHVEANEKALIGEYVSYEWEDSASKRCFRNYLSPIKDADGEVSGVVGVGVDVTDFKLLQQELTVSLARFRNLFDNHSAVMLLIDPSEGGKIVDANVAAVNFYGYSKDEIIGINMPDIDTDVDSARESGDKISSASRYQYHIHRLKDGSLRNVEVHSSYINEGQRSLLFSIIHDVTDRVHMERMLEGYRERLEEALQWWDLIFYGSSVGVAVVDGGDHFKMVNQRFCDILGYSEQELLGEDFLKLFINREEAIGIIKSLLDSDSRQRIRKTNEVQLHHMTGNPVWCEIASVVVESASGAKDILWTVIDVTQRREAQAKILRNERMMRLSDIIAKVGGWEYNLNKDKLRLTSGASDILGAGEDIGLHDLSGRLFNPESNLETSLHNLRFEGERFDDVFRMRNESEDRWIRIIAQKEKNFDGDFVIMGSIQDVTESHRIQRDLRYKNALMAAQLETTREGILYVDRDRTVKYFNKQFRKIWNIPDDIDDSDADRKLLTTVKNSITDRGNFSERIDYLYSHLEEMEENEEVELLDGRTLERYSMGVQDSSGEFIGRIWFYRDVTLRKAADALRNSQKQQLQNILDSQPNIIILSDGKRIVTVNRAFLNFFDYDSLKEYLESNGCLSKYFLFQPGYVSEGKEECEWLNTVKRLQQEGQESKVRMINRRSGDESVFLIRTSAYAEENLSIVSFTDISEIERYQNLLRETNNVLEEKVIDRTIELVKANQNLEKSRRLLEEAQGLSHTGSWECFGKDNKFTMSGEVYRIFGYEPYTTAMGYDEFLISVHSDDRMKVANGLEAVRRNGESLQMEFRIKRRDGSHRYIRSLAMKRKSVNGDDSVYGFFQDITDRMEAETRYQTLFNSSADAIFLHGFGADGNYDRFEAVNDTACNLLGYSRADLLKKSPCDIMENYDEGKRDEIREFLVTGHLIKSIRLIRADKELIPCDLNGTIFQMGNRSMAILSIRDVSEKRQMEQEQREREQLMIHQSRMASMGEMMGAIAHQWRQPLSGISLIIQDLADAYDYEELTPEYMKEATDQVMKQVDFMNNTITDFRDFFRPSREAVKYSIQDSIREVFDLVGQQLLHNGIQLNFEESDNGTLLIVEGYPNELKHVLLNLLNNSRDAILRKNTGEGKIILKIRRSGDAIEIMCTDNGGGIPPEVLDRIFEPYFTTKGEKGMGIGLYMSKMILKKMNANIRVENEGEGAKVTITIPDTGI